MILTDEQFKRWHKNGMLQVEDCVDTINDLKRQLAEHEEAAATAMRTVLEGQNSEKYPQLIALRDAYVQEKVTEIAAKLQSALDAGFEYHDGSPDGTHYHDGCTTCQTHKELSAWLANRRAAQHPSGEASK